MKTCGTVLETLRKKSAGTAVETVTTFSAQGRSNPNESRNVHCRGKWQERWHAMCSECFEKAQPYTHYPEHRLRLLLAGHNSFDHAWQTGYSYSNPTNRMWMLLTGSLPPHAWNGIVPSKLKIHEQNLLPYIYGIRFTSIGDEPGNEASKYGKTTMTAWRESFFKRLCRHSPRVCHCDHKTATETVTTDKGYKNECTTCLLDHAPVVVSFSGKRQFCWLFSPPLSKIESYGKQKTFPITVIFVLEVK
ncbi:hypothetical protein PsorP6_000699 [Peronosclerospora sorghi]|uniref:Uncharacterized protein n=1 Tax=Peronosclerospora sorghi TaxID=230839 RepID=A0ACC0WUB7_9STRA|nr:hypothetical protein PsorP6_000699 [Peronosclerospora sorghi]